MGRKKFRNIRIDQILSYRLPAAGIMSILHRVSGASLFLMFPFIVYFFDLSLSSEQGYKEVLVTVSPHFFYHLRWDSLGLFTPFLCRYTTFSL